MPALRLILGDQLTSSVSSLADLDTDRDLILIAEVMEEASYVRHHKKKLVFAFSAMRHFAAEMEGVGATVRYVRLDDPQNTGSLFGEIARTLEDEDFDRLVVTEPGEVRLASEMKGWEERLQLPVDIREDDRFLCSHRRFRDWGGGRKELRMEYFYREMRKETGFLMKGDKPAGGRWNFDKENRKPLTDRSSLPRPYKPRPDAITKDVIAMVEDRFADYPGKLDGFHFAVTRKEAETAFERFASEALPCFGDYQDAMAADEPWLFHAVISPYLNAGLLDPYAVCARVDRAWREGDAPLNAAEGFIRQIIGWREYVRGIYWLTAPDYGETNTFAANRPLPDFFWTAETDMNCLKQAIGQTLDEAYAHHIQRLMVIGNFALLAGLAPKEVCEWYLAIYIDAYEWVELPNTHGMALHADNGLMATKPYAASGKYIDRMSDYCKDCAWKVKADATDDAACPFNTLYWDFLIRNEKRLADNPRMGVIMKNVTRMDAARRTAIGKRADRLLNAF